MKSISLIAITIIIIVIIKVVHSVSKRQQKDKKKINKITATKLSNDTPVETPKEESIKTIKELGKNKWLFPTDNFGKMEGGRE